MSVTFIMRWDIKDDMEQEYFQFVVREWVPATSRLGLQPVAAWYTQWRIDDTVPMIRAEAVADDAESNAEVTVTELAEFAGTPTATAISAISANRRSSSINQKHR